MNTFLDTSVLVAAIVEGHPGHARAHAWLKRALSKEFSWTTSAHALLELYAVLTTLPVKPRISPAAALRLIEENVTSQAQAIALTEREYKETLKDAAESGILGGTIYDALHARAARKAGAKRLLTLNPEDFVRAWPEGSDRISSP